MGMRQVLGGSSVPKIAKTRRGIAFLVAGFRDPFSAFLAVFFVVRPCVRHSGTALRPFRVFRRHRHRGRATFCPILRPPRPEERSLVQLVWAFGSDPRDPGSIPVGDVFSYSFNFFRLVGWRQMVEQSSGRLLAGRLVDSNLCIRAPRGRNND